MIKIRRIISVLTMIMTVLTFLWAGLFFSITAHAELLAHVMTATSSQDGSSVTFHCNEQHGGVACPWAGVGMAGGLTLTLNVPDYEFNEKTIPVASYRVENVQEFTGNVQGGQVSVISFYKQGETTALTSRPSAVGNYEAKVTITYPATEGNETVTLVKSFKIYKPDFNYGTEKLSNKAGEDDVLYKKVYGPTDTETDMDSSLRIYLTSPNAEVTLYKVAEVNWNEGNNDYDDPQWVQPVLDWLEEQEETARANAATPALVEANAVNEKSIADFYKAMLMGEDRALLTALEDQGTPYFESIEGTDGESVQIKKYVTFDNLTFGAYAAVGIIPGVDGASDVNFSPVVVFVAPEKTGPTGNHRIKLLFEATLKDQGAAVDKYINEKESDIIALGEEVEFEINVNMPTIYDEYLATHSGDYTLKVQDNMSKAFELVEGSLKIHITDKDGDELGTDKYAVSTVSQVNATTNREEWVTTINLDAASISTYEPKIDRLYITYKAIVTDQVEVGTENNYNKVELSYVSSVDGGIDRKTATVKGYTYGLNLIKADGNTIETENPLYIAGAQFKLYKKVVTFVDGEKMEESSGFIMEAPSATPVLPPWDLPVQTPEPEPEPEPETLAEFKEASDKYYIHEFLDEEVTVSEVFKLITTDSASGDAIASTGIITSEATSSGVYIKGLDEGTYVLEEIVAPNGYSKVAEDVMFTIYPIKADLAKSTYGGSYKYFADADEEFQVVNEQTGAVDVITDDDGYFNLTVLNYKGLTLPATGGAGTLLFTFAGVVIMIGIIVVFMVRRKKVGVDYYLQ